ncbi:MAG TPA: DUF4166 domain-containing protein, partial [Phenylobacterium sp.]
LPPPGRYDDVHVEVRGEASGETWTRRFGRFRFASRLVDLPVPGAFEERFGPMRFRFAVDPQPWGFRWRFLELRVGPFLAPRALWPRIKARAFADAGGYRFSQVTALPLIGVLFAYAGRLAPIGERAPGA